MIYENYEQFVEYLNSLETDNNKLNTIFKYVLEKVHYNYDILTLAKIQANENWEFERYIDIENQQQRNEALKNLQKKYGFSSESFSLIDESYGSYQIIEGRKIYTSLDLAVSGVLLHLIEEPKMFNGLLEKGVCKNIAQFVYKVCNDVGIECAYIEGLSSNNIHHAWNKIKIDDEERFFDFTYELFIRDNHDAWGDRLTKGSWLGLTLEQMQQIQPSRYVYFELPGKASGSSLKRK